MRLWYGAIRGSYFVVYVLWDKTGKVKLVCSFDRLFQSLLTLSPNQRKNVIQANQKDTGTVERLAPATLKEFSLMYFRYQSCP